MTAGLDVRLISVVKRLEEGEADDDDNELRNSLIVVVDLLESITADGDFDGSLIAAAVDAIVNRGLVLNPLFGDYSKIKSIATRACLSLDAIHNLICKLPIIHLNRTPLIVEQIAASVVKLISAYHSCQLAWASQQSQQLSLNVLDKLMKWCNCENEFELVCGQQLNSKCILPHGVARPILMWLKDVSRNKDWCQNPCNCEILAWIVLRIKSPILSTHIFSVMPLILQLSDDHQMENKILGIRCLNHLITNTVASELRKQGFDDLIFHSLKSHLYKSPDVELINSLLPCLLQTLNMLYPKCKETEYDVISRHDNVLQQVLQNLEFTTSAQIRDAYIAHLPSLIQSLDMSIAKYAKRLNSILCAFLREPVTEEQFNFLKLCLIAFEAYLRSIWMISHQYFGEHFVILMQIFHDISNNSIISGTTKESLTVCTRNCFTALRVANPQLFQEFIQRFQEKFDLPILASLAT